MLVKIIARKCIALKFNNSTIVKKMIRIFKHGTIFTH